MVFTVICALMLVDEAESYSRSGIVWVMGSVALMITGIQVMLCKTKESQ